MKASTDNLFPAFIRAAKADGLDYFELSAVVEIARWSALRELDSFCHHSPVMSGERI